MQDSGSINSSYTHIPLEIILHPKLYGMILLENDQRLEAACWRVKTSGEISLPGLTLTWWTWELVVAQSYTHGGWKAFPWMILNILKMDEQGCRFVPYTFSETIRHRWLNIGETRVWRLDSGPNLQPWWNPVSFTQNWLIFFINMDPQIFGLTILEIYFGKFGHIYIYI